MPAIAILTPKGGAGKSTLAIHLARALQRRGRNVLIVDSDPQASTRMWSTIEPPAGIEPMPPVVGIDRPALEKEVPKLQAAYDTIVIDGAARLEDMVTSAIRAADLVLIPVQPSPFDIWGNRHLVELIQARQAVAGRPLAAFVVSRQALNTRMSAEADGALAVYGLPILKARTANRVAYAEAPLLGVTAYELDPGGKAAGEIDRITDETLRLLETL
jgi:chromosome partitioning protein